MKTTEAREPAQEGEVKTTKAAESLGDSKADKPESTEQNAPQSGAAATAAAGEPSTP